MFKVGQKVVCVDDHSKTGRLVYFIKKGEIYVISEINECSCGRMKIILKEAPILYNELSRCLCGNKTKYLKHCISRFRPLDHQFAENLCEKLSQENLIEAL